MIRHTYIIIIKIISIDKYTGLQVKYAKADCEHAVYAADFFTFLGYVALSTNKYSRHN